MTKNEKIEACILLCTLAIKNAEETKQEAESERSALFKALNIEDQDTEKIEDPQLYGIANDLEFNSKCLEDIKEELEAVVKDFKRIKF